MDSTDPTSEIKDKNATDYVEEPSEVIETVDATNDPLKARKSKKINSRRLEKAPKIGRNQPCPCGSGKKYKHCHLLIQREQIEKQREIRRQVDEFTKKVSERKVEETQVPQISNPEL